MSNWRRLVWLTGAAAIALPALGSAAASEPPATPTSGADPYLPTGPLVFSATRRPDERSHIATCSFRHPVCVHARGGAAPEVVLGALTSLERASSFLVDTVGLPRPLADGRAGGNPAFDLYLV